ncbi:MAG TPA: M1 family aminopeptidase [Burkholderiales bacterium]|nr:M1 family aminopeptidase [Burkholderiales bacterium]
MRGAALVLSAGLVANAAAAVPGLEPGVSRELAQWRAKQYRDIRYSLKVLISPGAATLQGTARVEVTLPRRVPELVLDWRPSAASHLSRLRINGKPARARLDREHLVVSAKRLRAGKNRLTFAFESPIAASGSAVTRYLDREDRAEYVYTLFVPSDASSAFPCFDQPDLKARFKLELLLPRAWTAVGNAPVTRTEDAGNRVHRVEFAETHPISTYLFAFAAGPFAEIFATPGGTRLFVRKSQLARARQEAPELLRLNREAVRWFERYFDSRFPFPKYDLVLVPELAYGGMEHAGATFLREDAMLFPSVPSETDILARAEILFHEASHQWFGDSMTMRWFDDLWLKEGFANFMAAKAAEALLPTQSVWNAFHALKTAAYRTDVTQGTIPIYRPLANLAGAKSVYGNIVYGKAPAVLRQAEFFVGEEAFQSAVRQLLKQHAYGNADWSDFVRALERASRRKLGDWAEAWVKGRGMPEIRLSWDTDREGQPRNVILEQHDTLGEGLTWPMKLTVFALPEEGLPRSAEVELRGERTPVPQLDGMPEIDFAFPNFGDYGYGRFLLDPASRDAVLERPEIVQGTLLRALVFGALWDAVRDAELAPLAYLDFVIRVAPVEHDPVTLAALLSRAQAAFLAYVSDGQRDEAAPRFEQLLTEGMLHADTPGRRVTFLRTFMASAWSENARSQLKLLLAGTLEVPGVKLSSRDRFRAIARLLALDDPEAKKLLSAQAAADPGTDGRRYAFAAGAAERSAEAKQHYFERFFKDNALAESWIEAALPPFNAPEHAELTQPFLDLALAALPELKKKRKIFFVNDWLAAFIGGQLDAQALDQVGSFSRQPDLDPDLRLQVLEAMDGLARTVKIRARFARTP